MHSSPDPLKTFTWFALVILLLITAGCSPGPVTPQSPTVPSVSPTIKSYLTSGGGDTPIWSPDSTQLIIVQRDSEDRSIRWDALIDLQNEMAIKIGEELQPVGWMVLP